MRVASRRTRLGASAVSDPSTRRLLSPSVAYDHVGQQYLFESSYAIGRHTGAQYRMEECDGTSPWNGCGGKSDGGGATWGAATT